MMKEGNIMSAALLPIVNTINTYLSDYILFFLLIAVIYHLIYLYTEEN